MGIGYDNGVFSHNGGTSINFDQPLDDTNFLTQTDVKNVTTANSLTYDMSMLISEGMFRAVSDNSLGVQFDAEKKKSKANIEVGLESNTAMTGGGVLEFGSTQFELPVEYDSDK